MKLSARALRLLFYAAIAGAVLFLLVTVTFNLFDAAQAVTGMSSVWLAGLCCALPFVLAGIALARESGSAP